MLSIERLEAGYDGAQVLFGVDLKVGAGEVVAILGRNGMGKTTTVRALFGLIPPSAGRIIFEGEDLTGQPPFVIGQRGLSLVPEGRQVFPTLTVEENLVATAGARFGAPRWTLPGIYNLFPCLAERRYHLGAELSGGEQQMLAIGRALMTNPKLIVLDEATEGLAPLIRSEIWACLARLKAEGVAIVVIDKNVEALTRLADRHVVIEKGRVAWAGTSAELSADRSIKERYLHVGTSAGATAHTSVEPAADPSGARSGGAVSFPAAGDLDGRTSGTGAEADTGAELRTDKPAEERDLYVGMVEAGGQAAADAELIAGRPVETEKRDLDVDTSESRLGKGNMDTMTMQPTTAKAAIRMPPGITKAGEGFDHISWNILGQTYVPKQVSEASFSWHATFPPGTFVPPHIHPTQDEFIYMLEGQFELMLDGKTVFAGSGDLIRMPMGIPHGIFNKSDRTVKCFFWVAPTRRLYDLFWAIHNMPEQTPAEVVALSAKHEVDFLPPPDEAK
jgi:branched-chain amino acid transport system ATP-binding protein